MFIVSFPGDWFLRGAVVTGDIDRATRFPTEESARAALTANRKFLKSSTYRAAKIARISLPDTPVFGEPR